MSFITHLKKTSHEDDTRWIVKYDNKDRVKEEIALRDLTQYIKKIKNL